MFYGFCFCTLVLMLKLSLIFCVVPLSVLRCSVGGCNVLIQQYWFLVFYFEGYLLVCVSPDFALPALRGKILF